MYLFSDELMASDSSTDPEVPPDDRVPKMAGMGSSLAGGMAGGEARMDGFGSALMDRGK